MYIDQNKILEATNGGLDIILSYYPEAHKAAQDQRQKFKIRKGEKTPSASLKQVEDGTWIITDWGADSKHRNAIQLCMDEENLEFRDALIFLAQKFNLSAESGSRPVFAKDYEKLPAQKDDKEGDYKFEIKEFTEKELALIGPRVTEGQCRRHELFSLAWYAYVSKDKKTGELVRHVFKSNENYPIFQFEFVSGKNESWGKRLEPRAPDKADRFRYFGERPGKEYMMGLHLVQKAFKKINEENQPEPDEFSTMDEMEREENRVQEKKLPAIIICGGDRDALATEAATATPVVWLNSETAKFSKLMMKELEKYAYKIYYLGDIDSTGLRVQHKLAMQHLDMHLIRLPQALKKFKDHRGHPCKDVRDFLEHFNAFHLKELMRVAIPYRMWDQYWKKKGESFVKAYEINPLQTYNFLQANGFYRFKLPNVKTGYIYIRIQDQVVKEIEHVEVKNFVHDFLKEIKAEPNLRNVFFKGRMHLGEQSLSNLSLREIDFTDYTPQSQYFFFQNESWQVFKDKIEVHAPGETDVTVWHDEVIDHKVKLLDPPFTITRNDEGEYDIQIHRKDCLFLRYLMNTSRVHWKEEKRLKNANPPQKLPEEMAREQRLHLINKIYSLGYLLHRYKDPSRPWAVFAMDNKISEDGESHGGSGKSIAYKAIRYFMKSVSLEGRNPRLTENPHIYENVTNHTDFVLVDDANKYLKFDFFYSQLTGEMTVNPKHGKQYEIPFEEVPKLAITSNFALRDDSPSTYRRLLFTVFSDYYHEDKDGEYGSSWSPRDEFGKNLFNDFTEAEWNEFINTMAHCLKTYLSFPKIDPPMENVTKRNQITQMTQEFKDWADVYFGEDGATDQWVIKHNAYDDFLTKNPGARRTFGRINRFTKSLRIYCKYMHYDLNPACFEPDSNHRLMAKHDGKTTEFIYVHVPGSQYIDKENEPFIKKEELENIQNDDDLPF